MFNIGPAELIVILLVALLVVGPKRLPEVGRSIGKALREVRKTTDEVRYSFAADLDEDESTLPSGLPAGEATRDEEPPVQPSQAEPAGGPTADDGRVANEGSDASELDPGRRD